MATLEWSAPPPPPTPRIIHVFWKDQRISFDDTREKAINLLLRATWLLEKDFTVILFRNSTYHLSKKNEDFPPGFCFHQRKHWTWSYKNKQHVENNVHRVAHLYLDTDQEGVDAPGTICVRATKPADDGYIPRKVQYDDTANPGKPLWHTGGSSKADVVLFDPNDGPATYPILDTKYVHEAYKSITTPKWFGKELEGLEDRLDKEFGNPRIRTKK
ncbi:hypothetical protein K490DRAFT_66011 [Saccharata proteae CBS 121410]|uniref:Uncharacterized protein n=1 Tax=Saccharata proteae CBS 121410 TaxID=1314787 RepID=A0A9P4HWF2_9PEZI|nr:hypothetical protein K490DRAFT_66011 [Saccharata proteae CBS 121410]